MADEQEILNRWRLVLGRYASGQLSFTGEREAQLMEMEEALDYLYGNGFQCCYAFHRGSGEDPGYLHLHMAVNTVNFRDGKRFYETYNAVTGLRNYLATLYNSWQWSTAYDNSGVWEE